MGLIADQTTATPANRTRGGGFGNTLAGISFANWPMLRATNLPMSLALFEFAGFFVMLYGKNLCAYTALRSAHNLTKTIAPTFFPFSAGGLDIVTILFVVSAMAVIRGTTRQRVSAFRLAAFTSFLHVVLSWPSIVSGWKFSEQNGFWGGNCKGYVRERSESRQASEHQPDASREFPREPFIYSHVHLLTLTVLPSHLRSLRSQVL